MLVNGYDISTFTKGDRKEYKTVPDDFLLSQRVVENAEKIYNMEIREDDVWVVTPPKCGTTLMQEIVWCICNDMNIDLANSIIQFYRFPMFNTCFSSTFQLTTDKDGKETCKIFGRNVQNYGVDIKTVEKTPRNLQLFLANSFEYTETFHSPRFIKSHLPLPILPKQLDKCKVIYVARNIKDVCVSTYYQKRSPATFDEHAKSFKDGDVMIGNWFQHMYQAWQQKDRPNFKFIWYEDMKNDIRAVIKDVGRFLGKDVSKEHIEKLVDHVDIDSFRTNKMVNKFYEMDGKEDFVRKGIVGDWRYHFNEKNNLEWNEWIEKELERTGLPMRGWK